MTPVNDNSNAATLSGRFKMSLLSLVCSIFVLWMAWEEHWWMASLGYALLLAGLWKFRSRDREAAYRPVGSYEDARINVAGTSRASLARDLFWLALVCSSASPGPLAALRAGLFEIDPASDRWIVDWDRVMAISGAWTNLGHRALLEWKATARAGYSEVSDDDSCILDYPGSDDWKCITPYHKVHKLYMMRRSDGSAAFARAVDCDGRAHTTDGIVDCLLDESLDFPGDSREENEAYVRRKFIFNVTGFVCDDVIVAAGRVWMRIYHAGIDGFEVASVEVVYPRAKDTYSTLPEGNMKMDGDDSRFWAKVALCSSAVPLILVSTMFGLLRRVPSMSSAICFGTVLAAFFVQIITEKTIGIYYAATVTIVWAHLALATLIVRFERPDKDVWSWAYEFPAIVLGWAALYLYGLKLDLNYARDIALLHFQVMLVCTPYALVAGAVVESMYLIDVGLAAAAGCTIYAIHAIIHSYGSLWWIVVVLAVLGLAADVMYTSHRHRASIRLVAHRILFRGVLLAEEAVRHLVRCAEPEKDDGADPSSEDDAGEGDEDPGENEGNLHGDDRNEDAEGVEMTTTTTREAEHV